MKRRDFLLSTTAAALAGTSFAQVGGVPVRIIVGAPPGGSTDTIGRTLAASMGPILGRNVIVENKAGAGGNIAADYVAHAPADGNTLLLSFTSHAINATLYPKLPFDPVKDFTALSCIARSPSILVANPKLPVNNLKELIAYAKAHPDELNFAIGGVGSSLHMAGELFKMESGTKITNIPYKGTAPAVADLLAGQVQLMFAAVGNAQAQVKAGKLKALGVTTAQRLPAFPDVPAIAEVLPGYESSAWFGLFGPDGMKPEVVAQLAGAAQKSVATPEMKQRLQTEGSIPVGNSPQEFGPFVQQEIERWGKVVKFSGAKPE